jgi:hypothetical protein
MPRIATITPAAKDIPQGSAVARGMRWIFIRLTASMILNVKVAFNLCSSKVVLIIARISFFSSDRALLSLILIAAGDAPANLAIPSFAKTCQTLKLLTQ